LQNKCAYKSNDIGLCKINTGNIEMAEQNREVCNNRIGVVFLGRSAPGGQNVVDGLLKY
jgi:hypothetical protein